MLGAGTGGRIGWTVGGVGGRKSGAIVGGIVRGLAVLGGVGGVMLCVG